MFSMCKNVNTVVSSMLEVAHRHRACNKDLFVSIQWELSLSGYGVGYTLRGKTPIYQRFVCNKYRANGASGEIKRSKQTGPSFWSRLSRPDKMAPLTSDSGNMIYLVQEYKAQLRALLKIIFPLFKLPRGTSVKTQGTEMTNVKWIHFMMVQLTHSRYAFL